MWTSSLLQILILANKYIVKKYFPHKYYVPEGFYWYKNLTLFFFGESGWMKLWITKWDFKLYRKNVTFPCAASHNIVTDASFILHCISIGISCSVCISVSAPIATTALWHCKEVNLLCCVSLSRDRKISTLSVMQLHCSGV